MCLFFSFVIDKKSKIYYFDRELRIKFQGYHKEHYYMDSHSSICHYFKLDEDSVGKMEYNDSRLSKCDSLFYLDDKQYKKIERFIMKIDLRELIISSESAYNYCCVWEDDPKIRKLITDSLWALEYCCDIKDRPSVRKYITDSDDAYDYCSMIKDRPSVRKYITDKELIKKLDSLKKI